MRLKALACRLTPFVEGSSGAAAVEMALVLGILVLPLMNAFELGVYVFKRMEVEQAAQMAVQSVFSTCGQNYVAPMLSNSACTAAITAGAQSTSLGSNVTVSSSTEGDYCVNGSGNLANSGCGSSATGHYVVVSVTYTYVPLFSAASVTSLLASNIARTHYIRMS